MTIYLNQNFEGTGYDNSEYWSGYAGSAGGVCDPDYATSPLKGSQSLRIKDDTNEGNGTVTKFIANDTGVNAVYGFFRLKVVDLPSGTYELLQTFHVNGSIDSPTLQEVHEMLWISSGGVLSARTVDGGTLATGSTALSTGTIYRVWFYINRTSLTSGSGWVKVSTTDTEPGSNELSWSGANIDTSCDYTGINVLGFTTYHGVGYEYIIDEVILSSEAISLSEPDPAIAKAGTDTSGTGNSSPLTFNHTLVSGDDRLIVICVGIENGANYDVSGVTYGGVACTKAIDGATGTSGTIMLGEIWYLLEADLPADGSRQVAITGSGTATSLEINGWCGEYTGVNQAAPEAVDATVYTGTTKTIQNDIAPSEGSYVVSCVGAGNTSTPWAHSGSQVEVLDFNDASSSFAVAELRGAVGTETALTSTTTGTVNRDFRMAAAFAVVAASNQFSQAVSGTLTATGALLRQTAKRVAGASTATGALLRQTAKRVAGTSTATGALQALRTAQTFLLSLAGSLTGAGGLRRQTSKIIAGTLTGAGAVIRQVSKRVAGSSTGAGAVARVRTVVRIVTGSITGSGGTIKQIGKRGAGSVAASGVVGRVRAALLTLTGSLTASGGVRRSIGKLGAGMVTATGAAARLVGHSLTGTLTGAGALIRQTAKRVAGASTASGALTMMRVALLSLAGSLTASGTLARQTGRRLAGAITGSGGLIRAAAFLRIVTGSITGSGGTIKQIGKRIAGSVAASGVVGRMRVVMLTIVGSIAGSSGLLRQTSKPLVGVLTASGGGLRLTAKRLAGVSTATGMAVRQASKAFGGSIAGVGGILRQTAKRLAGASTFAGALQALRMGQTFFMSLAGSLTGTGELHRQADKGLTGLISMSGSLSRAIAVQLSGVVRAIGGMLFQWHKIKVHAVVSDVLTNQAAVATALTNRATIGNSRLTVATVADSVVE